MPLDIVVSVSDRRPRVALTLANFMTFVVATPDVL
jgi:hypothetical protein